MEEFWDIMDWVTAAQTNTQSCELEPSAHAQPQVWLADSGLREAGEPGSGVGVTGLKVKC